MSNMTIELKPADPAVRVRKPDGSWLKDAGETVRRTAYWLRRVREGSVEIVKQGQTAPEKPVASTKAVGTVKGKGAA